MKIEFTNINKSNIFLFMFYRLGDVNKYSKMVSIKHVTIVILTIQFFMTIFALYILGLSNYLTDFEKNTCEMTYMFEYPQYVVCKHI